MPNRHLSREPYAPEPLERRLIVNGMAALLPDLALNLPGTGDADPDEEDQEPAVFAAPALPYFRPQARDSAGGDAGVSTLNATSSCGTVTVSVISLGGVSEATPSTPGYMQFSAWWSGCGSETPPSSVTVGFTLSGVAEKNEDYVGDLTSETVDIDLVDGYGFKDVPFFARDDELDEPDETLRVDINAGDYEIDESAPFAETMVASGDYTVKWYVHDNDGVTFIERAGMTVNANAGPNDWPPKESSMGVKLLKAGQPVKGVSVTLRRSSSTRIADAKILDGNNEVDELTATTGADGAAYFRIRAKTNGGEVKYTALFTNGDGRPQDATGFTVKVDPA